jgi:anthranilate/para-aminobenzoate synthase component I
MSRMDARQFQQLASEGYNLIPVVRDVLADFETPLSTYLKLAGGLHTYLFESVQGGEKWGRFSIIGLPCRTVLRVTGRYITVETDGNIVEQCDCSRNVTALPSPKAFPNLAAAWSDTSATILCVMWSRRWAQRRAVMKSRRLTSC